MNENLDLTKILEGCPKGTKFYSTIYGEVAFDRLGTGTYPVTLMTKSRTISVMSNGNHLEPYDGECTLFPSKDQRDWAKFERFWDRPKVKRFDPKTLHPFDKVLVRDEDGYWAADFFSHIDDSIGKVCCSVFLWKQCIPYNEETKHLVGTTDDCPEFYKWWDE